LSILRRRQEATTLHKKVITLISIVAFFACAEQSPQLISDAALVTYTEKRAICADSNPNCTDCFGDLHIHTGFSYDARPYGMYITPAVV
jgi:hypothetical protein